jgi:hypothetical protein
MRHLEKGEKSAIISTLEGLPPLYTIAAILYSVEGKNMKQFDIILRSFQDVQEFVEIATIQPFRVLVGNDRSRVNAKSFMGMFSLNYAEPVQVRADCSEMDYEHFKSAVGKFLAI